MTKFGYFEPKSGATKDKIGKNIQAKIQKDDFFVKKSNFMIDLFVFCSKMCLSRKNVLLIISIYLEYIWVWQQH